MSKTPQYLVLVTDMEALMAVLVDEAAWQELDDDNDKALQLIGNTDDDKVYHSVADICKQFEMHNLEIAGEFIGAIY